MSIPASSSSSSSPQSSHSSSHPYDPDPRPTLRIFATVGTTRFDGLITQLVSAHFLSRLAQVYLPSHPSISPHVHLTIQYGKSSIADILADSSLASPDDGSQLIPEPGLRVIQGRRVYQNNLKHLPALDPGRTGTLNGLRIRHTRKVQDQVRDMVPGELGVADALQQALDAAKTGPTSTHPGTTDYLLGGTLEATTADGIELEMLQFAPDLTQYIAEADVVVSHAGSGTIIETLRRQGRPPALIVVPNTSLMDNHQAELADALGREGYLVVAEEGRLAEQIQQALLDRQQGRIRPFPAFQPARFQQLVDGLMGF